MDFLTIGKGVWFSIRFSFFLLNQMFAMSQQAVFAQFKTLLRVMIDIEGPLS